MKSQYWRWALLVQGFAAAVAASCGSDSGRRVAGEAGGAGGEAGTPTLMMGGEAATAGAGSPSSGAEAGTSGDAGGAAARGGQGLGEAGAESQPSAGAGGAAGAAGVGAGGAAEPVVDVGAGCIAPGAAPKLTPAMAGLPSSGLSLWLRADRGVYATEQQRVCAWADQSGNGHLFLANGAARPLWTGAGVSGQAAIDFDATGRYLSVGDVLSIPATSARTFIAVVQLVTTTERFQAIMQGESGTPGTYVNLDANTFQTAGSREGVYVTNNSYDAALSTSALPRVHVITLSTMTPSTPVLDAIDYRVNGVTQTLTRNAGGLGNGSIESFSGANFTLVGNGARALLAEAIVYERALTLEERGAVETALAARYAIE